MSQTQHNANGEARGDIARLTTRIPLEMRWRLRESAVRNRCTMDKLVVSVLDAHLQREEEELRLRTPAA